MVNLTLDVFWLDFMPLYMHGIGIVTTALSILVIYLMVTKTPEAGKPLARYLILMQVSIFFMDFCWGFLFCPIFLIPLTAVICNGILCESDLGMHMGMVLAFQGMIQVALSLTYTLHHKYITIARMTNHRQITTRDTIILRLLYWILLELAVATMAIAEASRMDLHEFLIDEKQFLLASFIDQHSTLLGVAYSIPRYPWIPISTAVMVSSGAIIVVSGCTYFVVQTLRMLGNKTATMSERTRKMQQGLTRTLVLQVTVPTIIQIVPIFVDVSACIFRWFSIDFINVVLCLMLCHASFHTIFLILTTPSYRAAVCIYPRHLKNSTVTPLNSNAKI